MKKLCFVSVVITSQNAMEKNINSRSDIVCSANIFENLEGRVTPQ